MTREDLEVALTKLPGASFEEARYVRVERDGHGEDLDPCLDFCFACADRVAKAISIAEAMDTYVDVCWGETDSSKRCGVCDKPLHAGGLTKYGVDCALGLTETDPKKCHTYVWEVVEASWAMMPDDPRWALWEFHAKKILKTGQQV